MTQGLALHRRSLLVGAAAAGIAAPAFAAAEIEPVPAIQFVDGSLRIGTLAARMHHYGCPGLSVALIESAQVRTSTFGVRAAGGRNTINVRTVFQAASISKAVTAIGMMKLVAAGRIGLDEDVRPRLKAWTLQFAESVPKQPITLRALLSHTAGVNNESYPGFAQDEALPNLADILNGAAVAKTPRVEVSDAPGAYRYSGGGYEIVEKLIEDISDVPFVDYMQREILSVAGMSHSTFRPTPRRALMSNLASGHNWSGALRDQPYLIYPQHAAASLWSTPSDLARLFKLVMQSGNDGVRLLPGEPARAMMTEQMSGMGLGFGAEGQGASKIISHAGWTRGYRSYFAGLPESCEGVVVMANGDRGNELAMEVVRGVARQRRWRAFAPRIVTRVQWNDATTQARAGDYTFADAGFSITLTAEGDRLIAATPRGANYTFYPISDQSMCAAEDGETGVFGADRSLSLWGMRAAKQ